MPQVLGRARPELRDDLRSVVEGNYVIFVRYLETELEVVRIIEGHRDIPAQFEGRRAHLAPDRNHRHVIGLP